MKFEIKNISQSVNSIMRMIGYLPSYFQENGEFGVVRKLGGGDYPRFHLYITQEGQNFSFNLHLDQKKPSYAGSAGHSGEYDGNLVEGEAQRIKQLL